MQQKSRAPLPTAIRRCGVQQAASKQERSAMQAKARTHVCAAHLDHPVCEVLCVAVTAARLATGPTSAHAHAKHTAHAHAHAKHGCAGRPGESDKRAAQSRLWWQSLPAVARCWLRALRCRCGRLTCRGDRLNCRGVRLTCLVRQVYLHRRSSCLETAGGIEDRS